MHINNYIFCKSLKSFLEPVIIEFNKQLLTVEAVSQREILKPTRSNSDKMKIKDPK